MHKRTTRICTRVCKPTGKKLKCNQNTHGKFWYTVEHCWTRLDTAEQYRTRLNTSDIPDAVEHSRTLLNTTGHHQTAEHCGTMLDTAEHCWTVVTVRTELDTHGHFDTTGHRWTADGQCRTLLNEHHWTQLGYCLDNHGHRWTQYGQCQTLPDGETLLNTKQSVVQIIWEISRQGNLEKR